MAKVQTSIRFEQRQLDRLAELTERFNKATRSGATNAVTARTAFDLGLDRFELNIVEIEKINQRPLAPRNRPGDGQGEVSK